MVAEEKQLARPPYISPEEYLERERNAFEKSEYYEGEIRPMAGASFNHNRVRDNVNGKVITHLEEGNCQSFSSDMRIHLPETTLFAYPDIVIVCGEPELLDDNFDNLLNPVVIIEVLSDGTEKYDRNLKFQRYQKIPSFQEYILIGSQTVDVEVWRKGDAGQWTLAEQHTDPAASFRVDTIDLPISLKTVYARTTGILV
ncbi:MAG: Uma2 family endonuclease [Spirosoma sp.]|nr:Uma2 family endonuclease [Spirosoma sp.]